MSTKREPLLSEYELQNRTAEYGHEVWGPYWNRDRVIAHYEAARDNDAELIQKLVNALHDSYPNHHEDAHSLYNDALDEAAAAGFKPSEP